MNDIQANAPPTVSRNAADIPAMPTQEGPQGIRYDFLDGCRLYTPVGPNWRVQLVDLDSDVVIHNAYSRGGLLQTNKRYHIRFGISVWREDELVFEHAFDAAGKKVLLYMSRGGIGDQLAWFGHAAAFAEKQHCALTVAMRGPVVPVLQPAYPDIRIVDDEEIGALDDFYARYVVLIYYNDEAMNHQPGDYRTLGLATMAAYQLGLDPVERRPRLAFEEGTRPIAEPYVCIAVQATSPNKMWLHPEGWLQVVRFLKESGYRVVCIDLGHASGRGIFWNYMPHGAEDQTGDRPFAERARWLRHAEFFIGLSSGLSWLSWAVGCATVVIGGYTLPYNEFHTPYRVINWKACNGCSNDPRHQLDPKNYFFCPRHQDTDRQFECSRQITPRMVIETLQRIPGFGGHQSGTSRPAPDASRPNYGVTVTLASMPQAVPAASGGATPSPTAR